VQTSPENRSKGGSHGGHGGFLQWLMKGFDVGFQSLTLLLILGSVDFILLGRVRLPGLADDHIKFGSARLLFDPEPLLFD